MEWVIRRFRVRKQSVGTSARWVADLSSLPPWHVPFGFALTGYTVKAMQRKFERGDWAEGRVWKHAPDGRIVIDLVGYQRWVESR